MTLQIKGVSAIQHMQLHHIQLHYFLKLLQCRCASASVSQLNYFLKLLQVSMCRRVRTSAS